MMQRKHRNLDNDVNGAGSVSEGLSSGRRSVEQQHRPGRNHATAVITRMKWTKEVNVTVMECFYLSKPFTEEGKAIRGYRQRMLEYGKRENNFQYQGGDCVTR